MVKFTMNILKKSDIDMYNDSLKNIREQMKKRLSEGWIISHESNSLFLIPPENDKRRNWGSVWTPVIYDNKIVYIPHWIY